MINEELEAIQCLRNWGYLTLNESKLYVSLRKEFKERFTCDMLKIRHRIRGYMYVENAKELLLSIKKKGLIESGENCFLFSDLSKFYNAGWVMFEYSFKESRMLNWESLWRRSNSYFSLTKFTKKCREFDKLLAKNGFISKFCGGFKLENDKLDKDSNIRFIRKSYFYRLILMRFLEKERTVTIRECVMKLFGNRINKEHERVVCALFIDLIKSKTLELKEDGKRDLLTIKYKTKILKEVAHWTPLEN